VFAGWANSGENRKEEEIANSKRKGENDCLRLTKEGPGKCWFNRGGPMPTEGKGGRLWLQLKKEEKKGRAAGGCPENDGRKKSGKKKGEEGRKI